MKTVTILCNEANAREFRELVKAWPELGAVVADLQVQGCFPGLRCMQVTITTAKGEPAKGVGALAREIGEEGRRGNDHE